MKKELVHGLIETVELKDWDFAIIIAALKLYAEDRRKRGKGNMATYAEGIIKKLRPPFSNLVRRTKREHRKLSAVQGTRPL